MDCSLPDSSVHGILQARIPERVQSYDLTASKSSLWFLHKLPHALKFSKSSFLLQSTRSFTLLSWRGYTLHTTHHWSMSLHPSSFSFHGLFFTLRNNYHRTISLSLSLSLSHTYTLSFSPLAFTQPLLQTINPQLAFLHWKTSAKIISIICSFISSDKLVSITAM